VNGALPHPTDLDALGGSLTDRFVTARMDRCVDPKWHFKLAVPKGWHLGPQGAEPPTTAEALTLALFKHHDPEVDLEVVGHALEHEIDPADWLELSLAADGKRIESSKHVPLLAGVVGDAVARWEVGSVPFAGRFFATKWGPRLFVLCLRAPAEHYARFAHDGFAAISTFTVLDDSLGLFAERVWTVEQTRPLPWHTVVPVSWLVEPDPLYDAMVGSWQARQQPAGDGDLADFAGQLSLALVARSRHERASELGELFIDMVRERGLEVAETEFVEEPPPRSCDRAWYLVSPVTYLGSVGELRCRVMLHRSAWVLGGVVGVGRDGDPLAWMRNKRALDIATGTLAIEGRA
jgi:hypothetical protein